MSHTLEQLADEMLSKLCAGHPLGYRPLLIWKNLRVTAGIAHYRRQAISLSRIVLIDEERLRTTLVHEYAHLLAVARHGLRAGAHGKEWREAMRDLGAEPTVRHRYEVLRNSSRQLVLYRCLKCGTALERSRKLPKRRIYVHASCGGRLRLEAVRMREEAA